MKWLGISILGLLAMCLLVSAQSQKPKPLMMTHLYTGPEETTSPPTQAA